MKVRDEAATVWTLPNRLSIIRILFIPVIVYFISTQEDGLLLASCLLFIIAGITDGLDGYLARKMGLTSRLGVYLDPIADKLLVSSVLITLTYYHQVPLWVTLILVGREFLINGLRAFYAMEGIAVYPSSSGKIKTALQLTGISFLLFNVSNAPMDALINRIGLVIIYIALFFSIYSAVDYLTALFRPSGLKS